MDNYFSNLNKQIKDYFNILSEEIPEFLIYYINTPEMQMMQKLYSNPEFREVSLQANRIAHIFKGIE